MEERASEAATRMLPRRFGGTDDVVEPGPVAGDWGWDMLCELWKRL